MDYAASIIVMPEHGLAALVLAAGPNAVLVELAAAAVLRSAATRAPLAPCTTGGAAGGAELDEETRAAAAAALAHLRAVFADPTPATAEAAFARGFLAQIPATAVASIVGELVGRVGRCERHELAGTGRRLAARAVLHCERGTVHLEITGEAAPPHRIDGVMLQGS
jgi:hypothetical protein